MQQYTELHSTLQAKQSGASKSMQQKYESLKKEIIDMDEQIISICVEKELLAQQAHAIVCSFEFSFSYYFT